MSNKERKDEVGNRPNIPGANPKKEWKVQINRLVFMLITLISLLAALGYFWDKRQAKEENQIKVRSNLQAGQIAAIELDQISTNFDQDYPEVYHIFLIDITQSVNSFPAFGLAEKKFLRQKIKNDPVFVRDFLGDHRLETIPYETLLTVYLAKYLINRYKNYALVLVEASHELNEIYDPILIDRVSRPTDQSIIDINKKLKKLLSTSKEDSTNFAGIFDGLREIIHDLDNPQRPKPYFVVTLISDFLDDQYSSNVNEINSSLQDLCTLDFRGEFNMVQVPTINNTRIKEEKIDSLIRQIKTPIGRCQITNFYKVDEMIREENYRAIDYERRVMPNAKIAAFQSIIAPTINLADNQVKKSFGKKLLFCTENNHQINICPGSTNEYRGKQFLLSLHSEENFEIQLSKSYSRNKPIMYAGKAQFYIELSRSDTLFLKDPSEGSKESLEGNRVMLYPHLSNRKFLIPLLQD